MTKRAINLVVDGPLVIRLTPARAIIQAKALRR